VGLKIIIAESLKISIFFFTKHKKLIHLLVVTPSLDSTLYIELFSCCSYLLINWSTVKNWKYITQQHKRLSHHYALPHFLFCLHYTHGCIRCHSLTKIYGNIPFQLLSVQCAGHIAINVLHVGVYADIYAYCMFVSTCFRLLFTGSVLQETTKPPITTPPPISTTILQSLRVQAPKSIEGKRSALWPSPYICQGGKAGGAALTVRTGEQYHSICHKPFHLWWDKI